LWAVSKAITWLELACCLAKNLAGDNWYQSRVEIMAGGGSTQDLRERVAKLEALLGVPVEGSSASPVFEQIATMQDAIASLQATLDQHTAECMQRLDDRTEDHAAFAERMEGICEETEAQREDVEAFSERMDAELMVLKRAIGGMPMSGEVPSKVKVPEPKPFTGTRSAKELENFLWDMEQYFRAARIPDDERVMITTMYLTGDAKLWWRTRDEEDSARPEVLTWESMRKELKD